MTWRQLIVQFASNPNDLSLDAEARVTILDRNILGCATVQRTVPVARISFTGEILCYSDQLSPAEERP